MPSALSMMPHPRFDDRPARRVVRGRVPRGKVARARAPIALELAYGAAIERLVVDPLIRVTREVLLPALPEIVRDTPNEINPSRGDALGVSRADGFRDVIRLIIGRMEIATDAAVSPSEIERAVNETGRETSAENRDQIRRMFEGAIRLNIYQSEPYIAEMLTAWARENVELITTMRSRYFADVRAMTVQGVASGRRAEHIASEIQRRFLDKTGVDPSGRKMVRGVSYQARRIARDQVNKLNGNLSRARQTAAGVTEYVWRTMRDERVRPEHEEREGRVFSWSDPPEGGHPGEAIQCRCYPEPVLA